MQEEIKILGVKFNKTTLEQAANLAIEWAKGNKQKLIFTPNPEFLIEAQKNENFLRILNKSDLNIADGIGILWASKYLKTPLPERVTGVDLMQKICEKASAENLKIFLLGAKEHIAEITKEILEIKYPGIQVVGTYAGSPDTGYEEQIANIVNKTLPDILFVAYGAPKQEEWIDRNLNKMSSVKIAMGVGGSFDFISKVKKRAPIFMQKLGIEWLYRLTQEPKRIKRIYNATIKFPIKIIF